MGIKQYVISFATLICICHVFWSNLYCNIWIITCWFQCQLQQTSFFILSNLIFSRLFFNARHIISIQIFFMLSSSILPCPVLHWFLLSRPFIYFSFIISIYSIYSVHDILFLLPYVPTVYNILLSYDILSYTNFSCHTFFCLFQCTTSYFEGAIAILEPNGSWVAKWQRIGEKWLIIYKKFFIIIFLKLCFDNTDEKIKQKILSKKN